MAITIDSGDAIFPSPAVTQGVWQGQTDLNWSDADLTVTNPSVDCGAAQFSIENQDGTAVDSAVFTVTLDSALGAVQTLSV